MEWCGIERCRKEQDKLFHFTIQKPTDKIYALHETQ